MTDAPSVFDAFMENPKGLNSPADANSMHFAIRKVMEEIETHKSDAAEFALHFKELVAKKERNIEFLQGFILSYIKNARKGANIPLPSGTLSLTRRDTVTWPSTETLLAFAKDNHLLVKITQTPNKTAIKEFIKSTGQVPDGYESTPSESLTFRRKTQEDDST